MTSFAPGVSPWLSGKGRAPSPAQHSPPRAESSPVLSTREVQVDGNSLSTTALGSNTRPRVVPLSGSESCDGWVQPCV